MELPVDNNLILLVVVKDLLTVISECGYTIVAPSVSDSLLIDLILKIIIKLYKITKTVYC